MLIQNEAKSKKDLIKKRGTEIYRGATAANQRTLRAGNPMITKVTDARVEIFAFTVSLKHYIHSGNPSPGPQYLPLRTILYAGDQNGCKKSLQ